MSDNQQSKSKIDLKKADMKTIQIMNTKMNNANDQADIMFRDQREVWSNTLTPLYKKLSTREPKIIMDAQSECLAIRSRLQDDISKHTSQLTKAYVSYKNAFGDRMEYYMTGIGVKTSSSEKVKMVDRDLAEAKRRVELLETHIEFLKECRYSCDQVGYSIKNIVGLISYLEIN